MQKLLIGVVLIVSAATGVRAQEQAAADTIWTLQECVDYAIEHNLTVMNQQLTVLNSEVNLKQAKMSKLPSLNASASYGYNWGLSTDPTTNINTRQELSNGFGSLNAGWNLFNGLRVHNTVKQGEQTLVADQLDLDKTKNDVILNIVVFYTNVIFNKELLENAKSQLASTQSQLDRTIKQVQAGALPRSSQMDLESQFATNELNVIQAENNYNLSMLQLKQAMMIPASDNVTVEIPEIELEEGDLVGLNAHSIFETAMATMPEVKSASARIESASYGVSVAQAGYYPRFSLSAGMNTNYSSLTGDRRAQGDGNFTEIPIGYLASNPAELVNTMIEGQSIVFSKEAFSSQMRSNFGQSLGIGVSIPIFNNLQANSAVQRSKITLDRAQLQAEQVRQQLRQTIETAYNDVYAAGKSYQSSERRVAAQEESFRAMKQRYDNGAANYTDYQVSENSLFQAKSDLLRAKYDYIFKLKVLDFYQGKDLSF